MAEELKKENYFAELNALNVSGHTEKKMGLTYLSWPWAWGELKKADVNANYVVYENPEGWIYFTDGKTAWVKVGVTAFGIEHIEILPIMDHQNRSIPADKITSFDVNKSIQRCLTKAIARHGIGLYIYAGEDLPSDPNEGENPEGNKKKARPKTEPKDGNPNAVPAGGETVAVQEYARRIGEMLKSMKATKGNLDEYKTIVLDITGDANFKCKQATEEQRDLVIKIYEALLAKGYKA